MPTNLVHMHTSSHSTVACIFGANFIFDPMVRMGNLKENEKEQNLQHLRPQPPNFVHQCILSNSTCMRFSSCFYCLSLVDYFYILFKIVNTCAYNDVACKWACPTLVCDLTCGLLVPGNPLISLIHCYGLFLRNVSLNE